MHISCKASFKTLHNIDLFTCVCIPQNTCLIIFMYEQLVLIWFALVLFALFWLWLWFAVICITHQNYNWATLDMVLKHEQCVDGRGVTCISCVWIWIMLMELVSTPCAGTIKERETQLKFDHSITLHQCKLYLHKVSTHKYVHIRCGIDHGSVVAHASFKVSFKGYVHIAYVKQLHVICVGYNLFACAHIYLRYVIY